MMKVSQKSKLVCLVILSFILMASCAFAQVRSFRYKADIQNIDSSGVYRIELSPGLIAKSNAALGDIRLFDNRGKNVAYVLSAKLKLDNPDSFMVFPAVSDGAINDTAVVYVAENKNMLDVSQLWLKLKNAAVSRTVNLSGSDDLKKWFAIKEDIPLEEANTVYGPDYEQSLIFPTSNYRYFKIVISGKNRVPVKILQAGIFTKSLNQPAFSELPSFKFIEKDTGKVTSLFIDLKEFYQLNKIHFDISGPKYYSRKVTIYAGDADGGANNFDHSIADTILSSLGSQDVVLSGKAKHIRIDIANGDDNALIIKSISAFQRKIYAVCYLESGHKYAVFTGDSSAKAADYDLSFINNRAYNQLPSISHSAVHDNPAFVVPPQIVQVNHSLWLWSVLILVLLILCFFTLKMVREIK